MNEELSIIDLREHHFRISNHIFDFDLDIYELGIYMCFCRFANNSNTESFPSITKLQKMLKISRPKVISTVKKLVEKKVIYKKQGHTGKANKYYLLDLPSQRHLLVNEINQDSKCHLPTSKQHLPEVVNEVNSKKTNIKIPNKKTKLKTEKFKIPTKLEVDEYSKSISFSLDAEYFLDYYTARGWMLGKNKIKDWKACVRTWKKNHKPPTTPPPPKSPFLKTKDPG